MTLSAQRVQSVSFRASSSRCYVRSKFEDTWRKAQFGARGTTV